MDRSPLDLGSPPIKRRRRSRKACEPCRNRKRKCDGGAPCTTCVEWEYACHYGEIDAPNSPMNSLSGNLRSHADQAEKIGWPRRDPGTQHESEKANDNHLQFLEANSGAAFVRRLGLNIDPKNAPRMRLFGWNTGERLVSLPPGTVRPITTIISHDTMVSLTQSFFRKFAIVYHIIGLDEMLERISQRWRRGATRDAFDQVLCGVAMLGLSYSQTTAAPYEPDLVETGRTLLDQYSLSSLPSIDTVYGWILRVAYLRIASTAHVTWMASCSLMHVCEAAQIHLEHSMHTVFDEPPEAVSSDTRRRLWAMAHHLHLWPSFDLGRTPVKLPHATTGPVTAIDGDYTTQMMSLIPLTEGLNPHQPRSVEDLESDFSKILDRDYQEPPVTMAVTNLSICMFRRLRAQKVSIKPGHVDKMLSLAQKALTAAQKMVATISPWHHAANMPFQILCLCLALETRSSLALVGRALSVLAEVRDTWNSEVLREAYDTAYLLILLHQRRREEDCNQLREAVNIHATLANAPIMPQSGQDMGGELWLDDLFTDVPGLRDFEMEHFLLEHAINEQHLNSFDVLTETAGLTDIASSHVGRRTR